MKIVRQLVVLAAVSALALPAAQAQAPTSPCGETVRVQRADTLSSIAERCDVDEIDIIWANPRIRGSEDLRAGMEIRLARGETDTTERLESLARETGEALSGIARDLGASVNELLERNPDLRQRLRGLGDQFQIPGVDAEKAEVSISPDAGSPGTTVTISAVGLPPNAEVVVGAGPPRSAYEVLDRARTSDNGTLRVNVRVPDWAASERRLNFVVAGEDEPWKVRSEPFELGGTRL